MTTARASPRSSRSGRSPGPSSSPAFELFVASLQAYVFTLLTAVYISGAMEPAH